MGYSSVESVRGSSVLFYVIKIHHLTIIVLIPFYKIRVAKHLIVILLRLEVLRLITIAAFTLFFFSSCTCRLFLLTRFRVFVCEACLGLGVLINSSRVFGNDYMSTLA